MDIDYKLELRLMSWLHIFDKKIVAKRPPGNRGLTKKLIKKNERAFWGYIKRAALIALEQIAKIRKPEGNALFFFQFFAPSFHMKQGGMVRTAHLLRIIARGPIPRVAKFKQNNAIPNFLT